MKHEHPLKRSLLAAAVALALGHASFAHADARAQAKRLHDRLAGVPPSAVVLDQMTTLISGGNADQAARVAMQSSSFYSVVLKNLVSPWTNRDQSAFVPLNDYTAT